MFKKIFKFLKGYVIIEISGKNKERFLNMCLEDGIIILSALPSQDRILVCVLMRDFKVLRPIVRKCGVRVRLISKHGLCIFAKRNKARWMLPVAGIVFFLYLFLMPRFIWCVEINGATTADTERIVKTLSDMGVYVGAKKSGIANLTDIKNAIVFGDDRISWAWLYVEGAKARLEVAESVMPPEVFDKTAPSDIIAVCDGYVKEAHILRGERRVSEGMTVLKGDLLVSGKVPVYIEGEEEKYSYVNSNARIIADTSRVSSGEFPVKRIVRVKTGAEKTRISFEIFGKEFFPFGRCDDDFAEYDKETTNYDLTLPFFGYIGLSLGVHRVYEINEISHTMNESEVLRAAQDELEENICKGLTKGAIKLSDKLTYSEKDGIYNVTLTMNLRENIGIRVPIEE